MPIKHKYVPEVEKPVSKGRLKMSDLNMYIDYTVTREQYMRDRERT